MNVLEFVLEMKSDWHVNAGYGEGSLADAVIERDRNGNPQINGSTLKGLFRDALYEIGKLDYIEADNLESVLGSVSQPSAWRFTNAVAITHQDTTVVTGVRVHPRRRSAAKHAFYQREIAGANLFRFQVIGTGNMAEVELLVAAARYVRHLGGRRRRGSGECELYLEDSEQQQSLQDKLLSNFEARYLHRGELDETIDLPKLMTPANSAIPEGSRVRVTLRAEQPILIAQKPESGNNFSGRVTIPGRSLRGALAQLANPSSLTQEEFQIFAELFVHGGIKFSELLPVDNSGYIVDQVPMGTQVNSSDGLYLETAPKRGKDYKGFFALAGDLPRMNTPPRQMRLHVQMDKQLKSASAGNLYSYEAIPAGQMFVGEITLNDWSNFSNLTQMSLVQSLTIFIGKSTSRGYGRCSIWLEALDDGVPPLHAGVPLEDRTDVEKALLYITLATDLILIDDLGRAVQDFHVEWLAKMLDITEHDLEIEFSRARTRVIEGFDMQSNLPYWRDIALLKGSTVGIRLKKAISHDHLHELEDTGYGLRKSEGFGRLVFNHPIISNVTSGFKSLHDPFVISQTPKETLAVWKRELSAGFKANYFTKDAYRSLARRLVEIRTDDFETLNSIVQNMGKPTNQLYPRNYLLVRADKQVYSPEAIREIQHWLQDLYERDLSARERRQGVVLLAEQIASAVRANEKSR